MPRLASTVGVDHTPAPEGPYVAVPILVAPVFFGGSTRNVCHTIEPSFALSAVTLPRKVQHGYSESTERFSPQEAAGTNTTPFSTAGEAVRRAASCGSTRLVQRCLPVRASSA